MSYLFLIIPIVSAYLSVFLILWAV